MWFAEWRISVVDKRGCAWISLGKRKEGRMEAFAREGKREIETKLNE